MAQSELIVPHMEVRDASGVTVGTVDHVDGERIKLTRSHSADGEHHYVPLSAVSRVDEHVHLNSSAAALGLAAAGAAAATGSDTAHGGPLPPIKNRAVPGSKPRGNYYLPWIVGIIGLILLILLFRSCTHHDDAAVTPAGNDSAGGNAVVAETAGVPQSTVLGVSGLSGYLGGTGATPATFTFEKLHFDTAKSDVRAADQAEVDQVATVLKQYGSAKIRIAGYADDRGSGPANQKLGKDRADAVKAALVAQGIDAGRIDTVSGGESEPTDTNATAGGRAENRRTELVVVSR